MISRRIPIVLISILTIVSFTWCQWTDGFIDTITDTQIRKQTELQSLDLDSSGRAHLVWKEIRGSIGWRIFYSTRSPVGTWAARQEVGDSSQPSFSPALAVSPDGDDPFIVFEQNEEICVAYHSEEGWEKTQVTSNTQFDCSPTIAVDNVGLIHLAWISEDSGAGGYKIMYALGDQRDWKIQALVGGDLGWVWLGASPYLAVSPTGVAHVVYRGATYGNYHIHHAWNDSAGGSDWTYEMLPSGNINDYCSALIVEEDGDLHLAVSGSDGWGWPARVYYSYQRKGLPWEPFELASLSYSATRPSIDIDRHGFPHIVWMRTTGNFYTGDIFYSWKTTSGHWQVSSVIGGDHFGPSFKVDHRGFGHVACHTGGNTGIWDIFYMRTGEALTLVEGVIQAESIIYGSDPNPFADETTIKYRLPEDSRVNVTVHNLLGQEVKRLLYEHQLAGFHTVIWDATDNSGREIPSGPYFLRLQAGKHTATRKLSVMR